MLLMCDRKRHLEGRRVHWARWRSAVSLVSGRGGVAAKRPSSSLVSCYVTVSHGHVCLGQDLQLRIFLSSTLSHCRSRRRRISIIIVNGWKLQLPHATVVRLFSTCTPYVTTTVSCPRSAVCHVRFTERQRDTAPLRYRSFDDRWIECPWLWVIRLQLIQSFEFCGGDLQGIWKRGSG